MPIFALSILIDSLKTRGFRATIISRVFWSNALSACLLPALALIVWVIRVSDVTRIPFSPYAAQQDVRPTGLVWPWQRIIERFQAMLDTTQRLSLGKWLEGYQLGLILVTLIILIVVCWRRKLRWELLTFTVLSIFLPLMTGILAIGRFATLTFLPLAFVYIVPAKRRWVDTVLWLIGIILSLLVLISLNLNALQVNYVP